MGCVTGGTACTWQLVDIATVTQPQSVQQPWPFLYTFVYKATRSLIMSSYDHVPQPADAHLSRELGSAAASRTDFNTGTGVADFAEHDNEAVAQHDAPLAEEVHDVERPASAASNAAGLGRSNTLKKKTSVSRKTSLKHSGTRKSVRAPSVKAAGGTDGVDDEHYNNAFFTPIPTTGTPTDVLANRFQGMPSNPRLALH